MPARPDHSHRTVVQKLGVRSDTRLDDRGYVWIVTRKRGSESYLDQMTLVPLAREIGLIDNKTCSIDDERSGIRLVLPRALRRTTAERPAA